MHDAAIAMHCENPRKLCAGVRAAAVLGEHGVLVAKLVHFAVVKAVLGRRDTVARRALEAALKVFVARNVAVVVRHDALGKEAGGHQLGFQEFGVAVARRE